MADINQPTESQVKSISPDSSLQDATAELVLINIEIAGAYIYSQITRYAMPLTSAWTALNRMWAMLAAAFILTPLFPESEDAEEKNKYQSIVDKWLEKINNPQMTLADDAGTSLPLAIHGAGECPQSSTENILPMFYRPTERRVTGQEAELTPQTAVTEIVEETGKDNY